jgi:hypothetical protein
MRAGYHDPDRSHAVPTLRAHYATCIRDEAQRTAESIIRIGELLSEAKGALETDEWLAMVETDIGLRRSAAYSLMRIATTPALRASTSGGRLPASWRTLAELSRLDDDEITTGIEAGEITPTTTRAQASALAAIAALATPEEQYAALLSQLERGHATRMAEMRSRDAEPWPMMRAGR